MTYIRNYFSRKDNSQVGVSDNGNSNSNSNSEDNSSEEDIDMEELKSKMEVSIKNFSIYSTMKVVGDNKFVVSKLEDINKQRDGFKKIVEGSIAESIKLHSFADNLVVFAESCENDKEISNEDLLEALKSLKDDAINNRKSAMELKNEIENIKHNLSNTHKDLIEYNNNIKEDEKNIESTTRDRLIEKETQVAKSDSVSKKSLIAAGVGLGASLIALPFTGGVSAIPACIEVTICAEILFGLGLGTLGIGTASAGVFKGIPKAQCYFINYKLKKERDELVNQIGELKNGLENVYCALYKYECQLSEQETHIDLLIEKLEKQENDNNGRIPKIVARGITKKWKRISQKSIQYTTTVNELLCNYSKLEDNQQSNETKQ